MKYMSILINGIKTKIKATMNENLNLVEILKDCPKGTKLYSTLYGEVELNKIDINSSEPIYILIRLGEVNYEEVSFAKDGRLYCGCGGECTLFPSKDQRDWSKFKIRKPKFKVGDKIVNIPRKYMGPLGTQGIISKITDDKYIFTNGSYIFISNQGSWELVHDKKPKFDPKTLQVFDKVLVRLTKDGVWHATFFSHYDREVKWGCYPFVTTSSKSYLICIPYNDKTKYLVGTSEEAPEFYRYWED